MAAVFDDLGAWLVALLADAARSRLTRLVLGSDQLRALQQCAKDAIRLTASQLCPDDDAAAEHLALMIGEVFGSTDPVNAQASDGTMLEALQAGVARQLAVLDDRDLTGVGQSAAETAGFSGTVIARRLVMNLLRGIVRQGAAGGPLEPLSAQLNHDATHLQAMRVESKLDELTDAVLMTLDRIDVFPNVPGSAGTPVLPQAGPPEGTASAAEFEMDTVALLRGLRAVARAERLPRYLPPASDVTTLSRAVQVRVAATSGLHHEDRIRRWTDVVAEDRRVMILAGPGFGKSWLIRTETIRLADEALTALHGDSARFPIPLPLRCDQLVAGPGLDLAEKIASLLVNQGLLAGRSRGQLAAKVRDGEVILLLDALDELPSAKGGQLRELLALWAARAGAAARCVITSRIAGYTGPPVSGMREARLEPFTASDVTEVVTAWPMPSADQARLLNRIRDTAIGNLTRIPLLLALLCGLVSDPAAERDIPQTRGQLYERVLRWFLSREHRSYEGDGTRVLDSFDVDALLETAAPVALFFADQPSGWVDLMPAGSLLSAIRAAGPAFDQLDSTPADILRELSVASGLLIPDRDPSAGRTPNFLFLHRTIAEYLAARQLAALPDNGWLPITASHLWFDSDWAEVIPMLGEQLSRPAASRLLRSIFPANDDPFNHALFMVLRICGARRDADQLLSVRQASALAAKARNLLSNKLTRSAAQQTLAEMTYLPGTLLDMLISLLADRDVDSCSAAKYVLARHGQEVPIDVLQRLSADKDNPFRSVAVRTMAASADAAVNAAALDHLTDNDLAVRKAAAVVFHGQSAEELTEICIHRARDPNGEVRYRAVVALASLDSAAATAVLVERLADAIKEVREKAVRALAGRADPAITGALLDRIGDKHEDNWIRIYAIEALASHQGAQVTSGLIDCLSDEYSPLRVEAIKALAGRAGENITSALAGSIANDVDPGVRLAAMDALGPRDVSEITEILLDRLSEYVGGYSTHRVQDLVRAKRTPTMVRSLLWRLGSDDVRQRRAAVNALAGWPDPEVTDALFACLSDPEPLVRGDAVDVSRDSDHPDLADALIGRASDEDKDVRYKAVAALARHKEPAVTEALLKALDDESSTVRIWAFRGMARRSGERITAALYRCLRDSSQSIRREAIDEVARVEGPVATKALIGCLDDPDEYTCGHAVRALASRDGADVIHALLDRRTRSSYVIDKYLERALAHRDDHLMNQILLERLSSPNRHVRLDAVRALTDRDAPDIGQAMLTCLRDTDVNVRQRAASNLAKYHHVSGVTDALLECLRDERDWPRRIGAVYGLAGSGQPEVLDTLLAASNDRDQSIREAAIRVMADRDAPSVVEALMAAVRDSDRFVRKATAIALSGRPGSRVTHALADLLRDEGQEVRVLAAQGLASREDPESTAALMEACDSTDYKVRDVATKALARRQSPEDLVVMARIIRCLSPVGRAGIASASEKLTTRHYRQLTPSQRRIVHSAMSWLTSRLAEA